MQATPDRVPALAVVPEPPPAPAFTVMAEVAAWLEQHQDGQPPLGDRFISFQVQGAAHAEKMASLWALARFLDAPPEFRNEVWFVQRRFGSDGNSITLDAHYTPDHDAAFAVLRREAEKAGAA
jgi:hypothetical protein